MRNLELPGEEAEVKLLPAENASAVRGKKPLVASMLRRALIVCACLDDMVGGKLLLNDVDLL